MFLAILLAGILDLLDGVKTFLFEEVAPVECISWDDLTLSLVEEECKAAFFPPLLIAFLLSSAISLLVFADIIFKLVTL